MKTQRENNQLSLMKDTKFRGTYNPSNEIDTQVLWNSFISSRNYNQHRRIFGSVVIAV